MAGFGFSGLRGLDRRRGLLLVSLLPSVSEIRSGVVLASTGGVDGIGFVEVSLVEACCVFLGLLPRLGRRRDREPDEDCGF